MDWIYEERSDTFDSQVRLQALVCEMQGYIAENEYRRCLGQSPSYTFEAFMKLADAMRELLDMDEEEDSTTSESCSNESS